MLSFFIVFPYCDEQLEKWRCHSVCLCVCLTCLFGWNFFHKFYIWRASLRCDISYVLWDWVGFSLSFHIVYMNKVFISSTNLKWVFRCHILSENECSFGSLWTYYERIFETLWPCNLNHHPLGGGAVGTLGSESKEMVFESQTWKCQMGLELVSLIHGFVLGSGLWSIFWARNVLPLYFKWVWICQKLIGIVTRVLVQHFMHSLAL